MAVGAQCIAPLLPIIFDNWDNFSLCWNEITDSSLHDAPRSVSRVTTSFRDDYKDGLSVRCMFKVSSGLAVGMTCSLAVGMSCGLAVGMSCSLAVGMTCSSPDRSSASQVFR